VQAAAAVAMWLFDGSVESLPGGYDKGELSPNSPVKELETFPPELVLVGRATVLIKVSERSERAFWKTRQFFEFFLSSHIGVQMTLISTVLEQSSRAKRCAWPNPPPCSTLSV